LKSSFFSSKQIPEAFVRGRKTATVGTDSRYPRRVRRAALLIFVFACGGDDTKTDGGSDATLDASEEGDVIADVDVYVPPERAIWVASPTTLWKFDPVTKVMAKVADFDCSGEPMIDLAMNGSDELFGITSESIMRIDKTTGACTGIVRGAQNLPYATGFIADSGAWLGYKFSVASTIDPDSGALGFLGQMNDDAGDQFQASGDLVSLAGGKTYATTANFNPQVGDSIVEIDPATGAVTHFDGVTGVQDLRGIGQWAGALYVFAGTGKVYSATVTDAGVNMKFIAIKYDFGDAGADAGDADTDADASDAAIDSAPFLIQFRGAATTTRAPTQ
jgi:hypothetical protein